MEIGTRKGRIKTVSFGNEVFGEINEAEGLLSARREDAEACKTASPWQVSPLVKA